jgi:transcriptional regulator with XRE-family HTH domain
LETLDVNTKVTSATIKLGKRIGQIRKERGLSQEKLALEAGLNRAYIGYIERGERNPTIETVEKISKVLKVTLDELFK